MSFSWQQAGGLIYSGVSVDEARIKKAVDNGIRWFAPVLYNDSAAGPLNMAKLNDFKAWCGKYGVSLGGWFNGVGGDPQLDAANIAGIINNNDLAFIILDLEAQYCLSGAALMPQLIAALRGYFPLGTKAIAVSTDSLNDSMIWNGRGADGKSFRRHNIAVLPQWYNGPRYEGDVWASPVDNMKWLKAHGMEDNFLDPTYLDRRALALAQVHGSLEVSGVEGSSLSGELDKLRAAQAYGYVKGFSLYTLENMSDSDFALVKAAVDLRL